MIYKTQHRKLTTEQHEPHYRRLTRVLRKGKAVPAPLVAAVVKHPVLS